MTPREPWSDERLEAAFLARAGSTAPPPAALPDAVVATLRADSAQRQRRRNPFVGVALLAVVIVCIIGLGVAVSQPNVSTPSPSVQTSPDQSSAATTPSPEVTESPSNASEPAFPVFAQGLPVVSVAEAEAIRDGGIDDRELAVRGWLSIGPGLSCAAPSRPVLSPLEPGCGTELQWLLQDPERLVVMHDSEVETREPIGPAIHPNFHYVPQIAAPDDVAPDVDPTAPLPMVAVGHFDDRMAGACREEDRSTCEDRFVIDRVAWILGSSLPIASEIHDDQVRSDPQEIIEAVTARLPDSDVLSLVPIAGHGLEVFDPTLPSVIEQFMDTPRVWVVRVLVDGRPRSIYVTDDSHEIYLLIERGQIVRLADPSEPPLQPVALQDGRLPVVGVDGGPGELRCDHATFPESGLVAPTGAEERVGPEFDVLRATIADPGFADATKDVAALTWREAGRTDDMVVFLTEKPTNGDERYWLEVTLRREPGGWRFDGGGDCEPRAVFPDGVRPATWVLDPAFPEPAPDDTIVHLLVTESACASGQSANDRLAPAFVVPSPYHIDVTIGVHVRPGGQDCPANPAVAVEVDLGAPIGDRPLIDPNAPAPDGTAG